MFGFHGVPQLRTHRSPSARRGRLTRRLVCATKGHISRVVPDIVLRQIQWPGLTVGPKSFQVALPSKLLTTRPFGFDCRDVETYQVTLSQHAWETPRRNLERQCGRLDGPTPCKNIWLA